MLALLIIFGVKRAFFYQTIIFSHLLERDETLRESDVLSGQLPQQPQPPTTTTIDELSRQMDLQKLGEYLIATSDTYATECKFEMMENGENMALPEFFTTGQEQPDSNLAPGVKLSESEVTKFHMKSNKIAAANLNEINFDGFTDFDEIPALN